MTEEDRRAAAQAILEPLVRAGEPGLVASVLYERGVAFEWAAGFADIEAGVPWSNATRAHVASHTKSFTAYVAACLHEAGILDLDARIGAVLDDLPSGWWAPTLRQCLGNISGLPHDEQLAWMLGRDWRTPTSDAWLTRLVRSVPPSHAPGRVALYNDTNFRLAVRMMEQAAGRSFEDLLQDYVFGPFGMAHSSFERMGAHASPGKASTYRKLATGFVRHTPYMESSGDGAAVSTMYDLRSWARALLGAAEAPVVRAMATPTCIEGGEPTNYGLGLALGRHRGRQWFGHSGAGAGYAIVWVAPEAELAIAILSNRSDVDLYAVAFDLADIWFGTSAMPTASVVFRRAPLAATPLNGDYVDRAVGAVVRIEQREDVVRVEAMGDSAFLRQKVDGAFVMEDGRLHCRLRQEGDDLRLIVDGRDLHLEPVAWISPSADSIARLSGRYREDLLGAVLDIAPHPAGAMLRIAGGPSAEWCFDIEQSTVADIFRTGPFGIRVDRWDAPGPMLVVSGRGIPDLKFAPLMQRRGPAPL